MPFNREIGNTIVYQATKPNNWQPGDYTKWTEPINNQTDGFGNNKILINKIHSNKINNTKFNNKTINNSKFKNFPFVRLELEDTSILP